MKFWTFARMGRGDFFFGQLFITIVYFAGSAFMIGRPNDIVILFGFRTAWRAFGIEPFAVTMLRLGCDILAAWFVMRRFRDTNHSGWWWLALIVPPILSPAIGTLACLLMMLALMLIPGTIGPNRFGPDPRGWGSREHYAEQQRRLKSGQL